MEFAMLIALSEFEQLFHLPGFTDLLNYSCIDKQKHLCRMLGVARINDFIQSITSQTDRRM